MIIIAHRGLTEGPNKFLENNPIQIESAIGEGFKVEIDVRVIDDVIYFGHDEPTYAANRDFLVKLKDSAFFHCKNIEALEFFKSSGDEFHYFWHEEDTLTLTSRGFVWVYPGKQPIKDSIAVMPEIHNDIVDHCVGVCTDYPYRYLK